MRCIEFRLTQRPVETGEVNAEKALGRARRYFHAAMGARRCFHEARAARRKPETRGAENHRRARTWRLVGGFRPCGQTVSLNLQPR